MYVESMIEIRPSDGHQKLIPGPKSLVVSQASSCMHVHECVGAYVHVRMRMYT